MIGEETGSFHSREDGGEAKILSSGGGGFGFRLSLLLQLLENLLLLPLLAVGLDLLDNRLAGLVLVHQIGDTLGALWRPFHSAGRGKWALLIYYMRRSENVKLYISN